MLDNYYSITDQAVNFHKKAILFSQTIVIPGGAKKVIAQATGLKRVIYQAKRDEISMRSLEDKMALYRQIREEIALMMVVLTTTQEGANIERASLEQLTALLMQMDVMINEKVNHLVHQHSMPYHRSDRMVADTRKPYILCPTHKAEPRSYNQNGMFK